ncbi:unnamed protein product [Closterium sp. NIES-64]|nr:unnamed protein product [Closterium sp. NIES-64]
MPEGDVESSPHSDPVFFSWQVIVAVRLNARSGRTAAAPVTRASAIMDYVSDMSRAAPKGLFPPEPEKYTRLKLKVAIVGAGLAGMSTAAELLDQGHENFTCHARACAGCAGGMHVHGGCAFVGGVRGACVGSERGCEQVDIYEARPLLGGKVSGVVENLLRKEHTHVFINKGGVTGGETLRARCPPVPSPTLVSSRNLMPVDKAFNALALATSPVVRALVDPEGAFHVIRDLDKARPAPPLPLPRHPPPPPHIICLCCLPLCAAPLWCCVGEQVSFSEWFTSHGGTRESIKRMWDPVAYALGFIDCDNISVRCMLTIFAFFATKTEVSMLRMLYGSPDRFLAGPIAKYITDSSGSLEWKMDCGGRALGQWGGWGGEGGRGWQGNMMNSVPGLSSPHLHCRAIHLALPVHEQVPRAATVPGGALLHRR